MNRAAKRQQERDKRIGHIPAVSRKDVFDAAMVSRKKGLSDEALAKLAYVSPQISCTKCYGRGFVGMDKATEKMILCGCYTKNLDRVIKTMKEVSNE